MLGTHGLSSPGGRGRDISQLNHIPVRTESPETLALPLPAQKRLNSFAFFAIK
jgi:hypothetical protein